MMIFFYLWPHGGVQLHGYMIIIRAKVLVWRQLLSWGLFLDPKRALLQRKVLIHQVIPGLSTFVPMGFLGFFFFSLSSNVPMGFHGLFLFRLGVYIPLSLFGFFLSVFLYPSSYSPASLIPPHTSLESG